MTLARIMDMVPTFSVPFGSSLSSWLSPVTYTEGCEDWTPASDLAETDKLYTVTVELPGVDMKKVDVSFSDGVLTVKGEKEKEFQEGESCHYSERYSGSFERSIRVPGNVDKDKIDASYRDGVLKLTLPKLEESILKKIEIH